MDRHELASRIDHAVLAPGATRRDVGLACELARAEGLASVCVAPVHVAAAASRLAGSPSVVGTVIGFPTGASLPEVKALEAVRAIEQGAAELDVVLALGDLREGRLDAVHEDLAGVVRFAEGRVVKAILETALLSPDEIRRGCAVAESAGAEFVKTSTGFGPGGATEEAVRLLRELVGDRLGVKAAGGIRDVATARAMLRAGASRLGTSSTAAILAGLEAGD